MNLIHWFFNLKRGYQFLVIFFIVPLLLAPFQQEPTAEELAKREQVKIERDAQIKIKDGQKVIQKEAARLQQEIYLCKAYTIKEVEGMLKSPSTAKFSPSKADIQPDGSFIISGYVDSQNSYGAMIRSTYEATWKNGEIISSKFNGQDLQIVRKK